MIAWVDGEWVDEVYARIPVQDRGFLFGDGVFDTCRLFEGGWFRFAEHARRLHASAEILEIPAPPVDRLRELADDLRRLNAPIDHAVLRMTLTRGDGSAGEEPNHRLVLTLRRLPAEWRAEAERGWRCITAGVRHPPAAVMPPALKGQGRIFSLLAVREAVRAGCDQALLLSVDGRLTEGATWNLFWRKGSIIRTPAESTGLLPGVTRALVMELAPAVGYTLETGEWPRSELDDADEVFATMTSWGIVPIIELDGRRPPEPRTAAEALAPLYWDRVREERDE